MPPPACIALILTSVSALLMPLVGWTTHCPTASNPITATQSRSVCSLTTALQASLAIVTFVIPPTVAAMLPDLSIRQITIVEGVIFLRRKSMSTGSVSSIGVSK